MYWHFPKKLSKSLEPRVICYTCIPHQLTSCPIKAHLPLLLNYPFYFMNPWSSGAPTEYLPLIWKCVVMAPVETVLHLEVRFLFCFF